MTTPPEIDWARAKVVLDEVLALAPAERAAALAERCGDDAALHRAVEGLLAALEGGDEFLAEPDEPPAAPPDAPRHVGPYELHEVLGEGGFGLVYRATQREPVVREVAIKLLKPGLGTSAIASRFEAERNVLARMEHPGIAKLLDAGSTPDGRSYVVMELVRGPSIVSFCRDRKLSTRERVALVARACRAIHHAHQRAVIHRDIKPSNILVTEVDGRPEPRIIDFGIAKVLTEAQEEGHTRAGDVLGTPRYMSPEQIAGGVTDIRVDVYALGVVLCEALTGAVPRSETTMSSRPLRETPAERPSRLAESEGAARPDLPRTLRGDLDRIVMQCVEWDPDRRYDSAAALADELDRYLRGEAVLAVGPSVLYRTRKFLRRHLLASTLVAAALVMLVLGIVSAAIYARAEQHAEDLRRIDYFHSIALAEHALESARTDEIRRLLDGCPDDLRGWEWSYLAARVDESVATMTTAPYVAAALSPDGTRFANGIRGGMVEIWDVPHRTLAAQHPIGAGFVESLSFSPDGRRLAVGTRSTAPSFVIDVETGAPLVELPPTERVKEVLVHPDGRRLITGSAGGVLVVRALDTGAALRTLTDDGTWITALGLSPDGTVVAVGRNDGAVETWNLETGAPGFRDGTAHAKRVSDVRFSRDGMRIHSSSWDATVRTWDRSGRQLDVRHVDGGIARGLDLAPDGATLAVVTPMTIELRDAFDGTLRRRVLGQIDGFGVYWLPDPATDDDLVSWEDDAIKVWDLDARRGAFILGRHDVLVDAVGIAPNGRWAASAARDERLVIWDVDRAERAVDIEVGSARIFRLAFSPGSDRLAEATYEGTVRIRSVPDGTLVHEIPIDDTVFDLQWLDDDLVVAAAGDGTVAAISSGDGTVAWSVDTGEPPLSSVACDPTSRRVATGGADGAVRIWSLGESAPRRVIPAHERRIGALAWSPDGTTIASGAEDHLVRLWDVESGRRRTELQGHEGLIKGLDFGPDGTRLVSCAWEGEIRLWETTHGTNVLRLRGHVSVVTGVELTADGRRLVSAGHDGTVRIWEAPP